MRHTFAFIDIETTGLDPKTDYVSEIAVIVADARTLEVETPISPKVRIPPGAMSPAIADINGYDQATWDRDAVPWGRALALIAPLLDGCTIAGHNIGFDLAFLRTGWDRYPSARPKDIDYHTLDTASLVMPDVHLGRIESPSMRHVRPALNLPGDRPHTALSDAYDSLRIARHYWARAKTTDA